MAAQIVPEGEFNRMVGSTRNKASTLFSLSAMHLDHLLRVYGEKGLVIVCDRQGGRMRYGHLLRLMFEEWSLEILTENEEGCSEYAMKRNGHRVRITFVEKAEALCLPVAVASMLSKYVREGLMRRFNAFWSDQLPGLIPTAGYYGDGSRFLRDIEEKRREMGIGDDRLVRCR
jgi:DNA-binding transcriptional ArsR family regulator